MLKHIRQFKHLKNILLISLTVGLAMCALFYLGILEPLELKMMDHRFERYADRLTPSEDIIIVSIDRNSLDYLKNEYQILWKWPRDVYAYTIDYLTRSGAKAVLLDLTFQDPDINRAEFEEGQTDIMLSRAIGKSGSVITTAPFSAYKPSGKYYVDTTAYDALAKFAIATHNIDGMNLKKAASVEAPIHPIMEASRFVGYPNVLAEVDGVIRRINLIQEYDGGIYPSTALAAAMTALNADSLEMDTGPALLLGDKHIPMDREAGIYLNWYGPGDANAKTFKYYPIADVLLSELNMLQGGREPLIQEDTFRDKIVLIGSNDPSLFDLKPTPMSGHGPFPGVEILATAINNLLDGTTLCRESSPRAALTLILACILTVITLFRFKSPLRSIAATTVLLVTYYLYTIVAFYANVFVNMVPAMTGIVLCFVSVTLHNYLTEGKEKAQVKKAFSQYTSSALMDEILKNPKLLKLGGEKRDLSILFSDIRGFTSISEKLEPEQLTHMLNTYLTPMTDVVFRHKGILDKYIGDAIMAIFGAPLPLDDHPQASCRAALDMVKELKGLEEKWKAEGKPDFIQKMKIGIGINSGPVSVGNMGSHLRFDYTVIGDHVNLSSRLESATKSYGATIVVSQYTWDRTKDDFIFRELDYIRVMGKNVPIRIYELLDHLRDDAEGRELMENVKLFEIGLSLYRDRKWEDAITTFRELQGKAPDDKAPAVYIDRCENFINEAPPPEWDGVFERRSK